MLEIAKECTDANQRKRIHPGHIMLAIKRNQNNLKMSHIRVQDEWKRLSEPGPTKVPAKKPKRLLTVPNISEIEYLLNKTILRLSSDK